MALKLPAAAATSALCSPAGAIVASVVISEIIVAIDGAIMPEPLTMPATVIVLPPIFAWTTADFSRVSVVMMPRRAAASFRRPSLAPAVAMPARTLSIGRRWPMMPVDATRTFSAWQPSSLPVWRAMASASASPRLPVQTLEHPLFTTMPRDRP